MKKEQIKPAVKLGKLINKLRKEKDKKEGGYGLRKFAEKIIATDNKGEKKPMTHSNLSHIEHGKVWTTKEVLEQIAAMLDYEIDEMLAIRKEVGSDTRWEFLQKYKNCDLQKGLLCIGEWLVVVRVSLYSQNG